MIYTDRISIHPNMNVHIMKCVETDEVLKKKMYNGLLYGEFAKPDTFDTPERTMLIPTLSSVIRIISVRDVNDSIEIDFMFLNSELGDKYSQMYSECKNLFTFHPRGVTVTHSDYGVEYKLITFDMYECG